MNGYQGKILRVNLTDGVVSFIETAVYARWVGGHGMGSAIFWDLVKDKTVDGFDERNVVTIMTSPLTGTLAPGGASRVEVQGIGVQSYPIGWFTRSNMGGRFGPMLKYAGWDGIVIEGKASNPVWVDIRDHDVRIRDAQGLWGLDTWKTQQKIWHLITGKSSPETWFEVGEGRTTQKPAVMAIGPAGENLARVAAIIHDAGNAAGQGGFGAVWGAKKLKAISVSGTGSVKVANPQALLEARLWAKKHYSFNINEVEKFDDQHAMMKDIKFRSLSTFGSPALPVVFWQRRKKSRPQACVGCPAGCRARNDTGWGNESGCAETVFYSYPDLKRHSGLKVKMMTSLLEFLGQEPAALFYSLVEGKQTSAAYRATDLAQKYGINAFEFMYGLPYLRDLYKMGVLGPGKKINSALPFDKFGELEFMEQLIKMVAYRQDIGADIAEGFFRASERWGRLEEDLKTGLLQFPHWGLPVHYDPRFQLEWGYGTILGDRDINEHGFNMLYWMPTVPIMMKKEPLVSAEQIATIFSSQMVPFENNTRMVDYSTNNMYSEHMVKTVAWHRYYTRFWKQSILYCDFLFPDFLNPSREDKRGMVGVGEPRFLNAATGSELTFEDGINLGRKIWNLDNAIWTLQGRHRDMVHFAPYIYSEPYKAKGYMPGIKDGEWQYIDISDRCLDKAQFETWKTRFYSFEGWDPETGWPRRKSLEDLDMGHVADELEHHHKIGKG
ncbi:aldehyde ferredoxin oxidoreductase N-terminal domain-containing protein [candidate division CSSED10-310 bacterium]|uniref:Aldehyde ferredoxin oxidoreductase N-terminal domain-containing protein n=1 Tax=candidate division CSSED10-310 bacterium TaxID=2855610 RepID=A0ABV6YZG1_UNCC1